MPGSVMPGSVMPGSVMPGGVIALHFSVVLSVCLSTLTYDIRKITSLSYYMDGNIQGQYRPN